MRVNAFLRIALSARGHKVVASSKRPFEPLRGSREQALPTIVIKLVLELPDDAFAITTTHAEVQSQQILAVVATEEVA